MSSMMTHHHNNSANEATGNQHLNGAAVIDQQGREIMITEEMIQNALRAIEENCYQGTYATGDRGFSV